MKDREMIEKEREAWKEMAGEERKEKTGRERKEKTGKERERGKEMERGKERERRRKQSQKRYMVSDSLCPLISFFGVSYLVSFVVRGQRPRRGR